MSVWFPQGGFCDYATFIRQTGLTDETLVEHFYWRFADQLQVKKAKMAVPKLQRILHGTFELANQVGFQAMTLRDLSRQTDISMGGLYAYIGSKDELAAMIQRHLFETVAQTLDTVLSEAPDQAARLQAILYTHGYLSESMRPWFYFSFMDARHLPSAQKREAIDAELRSELFVKQEIMQGMARGWLHSRSPDLDAALIKAMLQDWYLKTGKYARRGVTVEAFLDNLWHWVTDHLEITDET